MNSDTFDITTKTPHFFKVVLENNILQGTIEIPKKFVKKYGNFLSSSITLKVPTGNTWQVELLKNENEVCLQKGWQEFADQHALKRGHFLVFKYEGDSQFMVLIFDTSCVEIEYPGSRTSSGEPNLQKSKIQDNVSTKKLDDSIIKAQPMVPIIKIEDSDCSDEEFVGKRFKISKSKHSTGKQAKRSSDQNISKALQAAKNFTSSYPSFNVKLKSSSRGCVRVNSIPLDFIQKHMEQRAAQTMMLKVVDKSWSVNLHVYVKRQYAGFYGGWAKFIRENSLKERDVCVFELIKRNMFNVHIFRS